MLRWDALDLSPISAAASPRSVTSFSVLSGSCRAKQCIILSHVVLSPMLQAASPRRTFQKVAFVCVSNVWHCRACPWHRESSRVCCCCCFDICPPIDTKPNTTSYTYLCALIPLAYPGAHVQHTYPPSDFAECWQETEGGCKTLISKSRLRPK